MIGLILTTALIGVCATIQYKRLSNPITVFCALWTAVFFLYALMLKPYNTVSARTIVVFYLQVIGFAGGALLTRRFTLAGRRQAERELNLPLFIALSLVSIAVLIGDALPVARALLRGYTLYDLAAAGALSENDTTGVMVLVKIFILFPTVYASSAVAAGEVILGGGKHRGVVFGLNTAMVALYALQHGERTVILLYLASYGFAWALRGERRALSGGEKVGAALLLAAVLLALDALTRSRGSSISGTLYSYFASIVPHADYWLTNLSHRQDFAAGAVSLYGFYSPVVILLRGLGLMQGTPAFYQTAGILARAPQAVSSVGSDVNFNAFVGPSYALYADGGYPVVFLGMLAYGFVCMDLYKRALRGGVRTRAAWLLLMCTVVNSFYQLAFCEYKFPMALLLLPLLYRKRRAET